MKVTIFVLVVLGAIIIGLVAGRYLPDISHYAKHYWIEGKKFYITTDQSLLDSSMNVLPVKLGWRQLLPDAETHILSQYMPDNSLDLTAQITRSIEASVSDEYKSAVHSTNIVESWLGRLVSIPGFIVPVELSEGRKIQSFFVVPYFGACIHYPPPPPNQMIYVSAPNQFPLPDMNQAYQLTGILRGGLYEDVLGTSAYQLELVSVEVFHGTPDDFRQH